MFLRLLFVFQIKMTTSNDKVLLENGSPPRPSANDQTDARYPNETQSNGENASITSEAFILANAKSKSSYVYFLSVFTI